jgi:hypothetical protein
MKMNTECKGQLPYPKTCTSGPGESRNGIPKTSLKGIKSKKEGTTPLSFVFKWTHISLQNEVHEPESRRDKNLASAVAKIISVTAMVYVIHNVLQGKPGRQVCVLRSAVLSQNV